MRRNKSYARAPSFGMPSAHANTVATPYNTPYYFPEYVRINPRLCLRFSRHAPPMITHSNIRYHPSREVRTLLSMKMRERNQGSETEMMIIQIKIDGERFSKDTI